MWTSIVDRAITEEVDLLAISGDIVDSENKSYGAIGPLESGLRRLAEADIHTVAVSGNHDFDILHTLSAIAASNHFHVLGRGGNWERKTFTGNDGSGLHIDGWSFPSEHVLENPLASYSAVSQDGTPVLGLLHGEVGVPGSRYAPINLHELWGTAVDLWLLGHIHAPHEYTAPHGRIALYPGSPLAMDPGEPGTHGVWLAEFAPGAPVKPQLKPISPVHYVSSQLDASHIVDENGFLTMLTGVIRDLGTEALEAHGTLQVVSCRLHLTGRSSAHHQIPHWAGRFLSEYEPMILGVCTLSLDTLTTHVQPTIELERYAQVDDLAGEVASLILALQQPDPGPTYAPLIRTTMESITAVERHAGYVALDRTENGRGPSEATARALLNQQAWKLLSELVAQKESA